MNKVFLIFISDFRQSGWSRGHMAPAGNNKHSQEAMNQTFLLTNIGTTSNINILFFHTGNQKCGSGSLRTRNNLKDPNYNI